MVESKHSALYLPLEGPNLCNLAKSISKEGQMETHVGNRQTNFPRATDRGQENALREKQVRVNVRGPETGSPGLSVDRMFVSLPR